MRDLRGLLIKYAQVRARAPGAGGVAPSGGAYRFATVLRTLANFGFHPRGSKKVPPAVVLWRWRAGTQSEGSCTVIHVQQNVTKLSSYGIKITTFASLALSKASFASRTRRESNTFFEMRLPSGLLSRSNPLLSIYECC